MVNVTIWCDKFGHIWPELFLVLHKSICLDILVCFCKHDNDIWCYCNFWQTTRGVLNRPNHPHKTYLVLLHFPKIKQDNGMHKTCNNKTTRTTTKMNIVHLNKEDSGESNNKKSKANECTKKQNPNNP